MKLNDIEAQIEALERTEENNSSLAQLEESRLHCLRNDARNREDTQQAARATVKVTALPGKQNAAWIGGSIIGSLATFQHMCMTRDEYEDEGPEIVHRKHFV